MATAKQRVAERTIEAMIERLEASNELLLEAARILSVARSTREESFVLQKQSNETIIQLYYAHLGDEEAKDGPDKPCII